jgi:MFS family permease
MFYLYAARTARDLGDGFAAIILPTYLSEFGLSPFEIGIVATAALLGSALLTLAIGLLAPYYDLHTLLLGCAALMFATGAAFPNARHLVLQFAPRVRRARWEKLARLLRTNTLSECLCAMQPIAPLSTAFVSRQRLEFSHTPSRKPLSFLEITRVYFSGGG